MTDPLVGTTVAHYEVLGTLGGGGMGVVYTARDTKLGRRVALKFLPPQWSHDDSAKQRFIREAQAASATDHRNIRSEERRVGKECRSRRATYHQQKEEEPTKGGGQKCT